MSLRLSDHKVLHNIASSSSFFSIFARVFSLFSLVFRTSNFWSLKNVIKQLLHSRFLDIIGLWPTRRYAPRWLFTISYPTPAHGIIVKYSLSKLSLQKVTFAVIMQKGTRYPGACIDNYNNPDCVLVLSSSD